MTAKQRAPHIVGNESLFKGMEILLVEDNPDFRDLLTHHLEKKEFLVTSADNYADVEALIHHHNFHMILLDVRLGSENGLELLPQLVTLCPRTPILMLSSYGTLEIAVTAVRRGARGFIEKSADFDGIVSEICKNLDSPASQQHLGTQELARKCGLIGTHPSILTLVERIFHVRDVDSTVLIYGESGTGKELVARALHNNSKRSAGPFRAINCGAIPSGLLESQMFGHRRGSFTDAKADHKGLLETCSEGTLLLDEVGEMPLELQVKLLRAIQEREVFPIGASSPVKINTRLIAATNKDLKVEAKEKRFREDLYYRLCVLNMRVPPLRERKSDIPLLVEEFLTRFCRLFEKNVAFPDAEIMSRLESNDWPGNVRELQNCIERGVVLSQNGKLEIRDLFDNPPTEPSHKNDGGLRSSPPPPSLKSARDQFVAEYLESLLKRSKGNVSRAARIANCHRVELHRLIRKHDIDPNTFRDL